MRFEYRTKGTCSQAIMFEINEGKVYNVQFLGGCNGNLQAVGRLVEGKSAEEVIETLQGIDCAGRGTSCADQLTKAVRKGLERIAKKEAEAKAATEAGAEKPEA